jgi:thioredoxin reductase (NADPH)
VQDPTLFELSGVQLVGEERRPQYDPASMETNVRGLFVAGTAVAGTQIGGVREFIETSHVHVERIVAAITGRSEEIRSRVFELPEA